MVAFTLGIPGRTMRGWIRRLAADLDAAGYNGSALRCLLWPQRKQPRLKLFSDLDGPDMESARRQLSKADLAPARGDPTRGCRAFRNLVLSADVRRLALIRVFPPYLAQDAGLWRVRS